jgi:NADH:ubiquinone oxidoreductase subunit 3 (subunit A)
MLCTLFCVFDVMVNWVYPLSQTYASIKKQTFDSQWVSFWLIMGILSYVELNVLFFVAS